MGRLDPATKNKLDRISAYLKEREYTTEHLHKILDTNNDGEVDPKEFVDGMNALRIPNMSTADYKKIFEIIDMDK